MPRQKRLRVVLERLGGGVAGGGSGGDVNPTWGVWDTALGQSSVVAPVRMVDGAGKSFGTV